MRRCTGRNLIKIKLTHESYEACGGIEHFISFEGVKRNILIGFLRLRFLDSPHRRELVGDVLVRELVVYGGMVVIGDSPAGISGSTGDTEPNCLGRQRISLVRTGSEGLLSRAESVFASTIGDTGMRVAARTW